MASEGHGAGGRCDNGIFGAHPVGAMLVIAAGALLVYWNSFSAPFVFDDLTAIVDNPTIRHLGDLGAVLSPPQAGGVASRPLINLSFALNYALGGQQVWGYHAANLIIHLLAGLLLFGIVRRTLLRFVGAHAVGAQTCCAHLQWRSKSAPLQTDAIPVALAVALLWTVHPLQTESVTCVVQRTESLMGLFYLLTLYAFIRGAESSAPGRGWLGLAVAACLAGMATKEVMVSAPLVVLFYDRTFVAGSFRAAWQRRRAWYVGLAGTWILLALLMAGSTKRGGSVGFGLGVSSWDYALTQCHAIWLYLKLSFWPHPLVVDYGTGVTTDLMAVLPQAVSLMALVAGTIWALWRRPVLGFAGTWFFAILAPSSSVVPLVTQTIAEHRMYLPLAAVIALVVLGAYRWAGRGSVVAFLGLAVGAGWMTVQRNKDYRSELALWSDTVAQCPGNARAHSNLGLVLLEQGRIPEAAGQYEEAIKIDPKNPVAQLNLCNALTRLGRPAEALPHGEAAVRLDPRNADAQVDLGLALVALGRAAEALPHYAEALRLQPQAADVPADLGVALVQLGRGAEAVAHFEAALRLDPTRAQTWCDLAGAYAQQGDRTAAQRAIEHALGLRPDLPEALYVLGNLEAEGENFAAAIVRYRRALALAPDYFPARNNLANALLVTGQTDEAVAQYRQILRQQPGDRSAQENLARALELQRSGRVAH